MPPSATRGPGGAGAAEVDDDVAQDREQPGPQRADLRVEALAGAPGADEGLLHRLFGQAGVAERAHREPVELAGVRGVGLADVALASQCPGLHPPPSTGRTQPGFKLYALEFPDLEDFRPAIGADALDRRATVFHGHLFGVFDLDLLTLFDAVTLRHDGPSFRCRFAARLALPRGGLRRM